jgi:hypothetical protein
MNEPTTAAQPHPKITHGQCPICRHYGDDCTGTPDPITCPRPACGAVWTPRVKVPIKCPRCMQPLPRARGGL